MWGRPSRKGVQKTLEHCRENPELVISFLNVDDFDVDLQGFETLRSLYQPVLQIGDAYLDSILSIYSSPL
jgi:hypothetical protein